MRALRLTIVVALMIALTGCGSGQDAVMPEVTGTKLDVALSDIERAGFTDDVEVVGGGLFGVVVESNWEVCKQKPSAGKVVSDKPRLEVDRSCGEDAADKPQESNPDESETEREPKKSETTPTPKSAIDAKTIEATFKAHLRNNAIRNIKSMCDDAYTHWACFYDGVEDGPTYLQVNLTTDGGWSESDLKDMAKAAGWHWFNFIACDFPDLDTIVVEINGLDHNVFRSDTRADMLCD